MKRRNFIKKTISFLTIICCLAGNLLPVHAVDMGGGSNPGQIGVGSTDVPTGAPHVTFTNEPNNSPDLFVSKVVENVLSGAQYEAPKHAAYQFVLKINGKVAANEEYRLLDSQYGEVIKKISGRKVAFRTDSSGIFTLEDGQTAWFEYVGTGKKYEVIELPDYLCPVTDEDGKEIEVQSSYGLYAYQAATESEEEKEEFIRNQFLYQTRSLYVDGYEQLSPAGNRTDGATTGEKTILFNGNRENFTNRYTGKGTGDMTTLKVSKSVSFPAGYTVPETPDFRFKVELDGEPYAGMPYTVIDTVTGKQIKDAEGTPVLDKEGNPVLDEDGNPLIGTDNEGTFTLKGGQTAVFENIPTELDYKVYELLESEAEQTEDAEENSEQGEDAGTEAGTESGNWWAVGDTEKKGSTQAPLTSVSFTNANVSFLVTKRMEDYSKPDVEFTFRLANERNDVLSGVSYYLYNTNGTPVYDQDGNQVTGITDEGGHFKLKPGQTAVFVGMEPGRSFKVTEEGNPLYTQVLPLPTDDTIYTVPGGGQPAYIDFVNRPADNQGALTVTKMLTYDNEGPLAEDDFHFVLYKQLKTPNDVKKPFVTQILFFELGSVDNDDISEAIASGKIILSKADVTSFDGNSDASDASDETNDLPECIKVVNGICYYLMDGDLYELYIPLGDAIYSVPEGLSAPTYKTDANGEFTIKANRTAKFEALTAGYKYLVREIELTKEYTEVITDSSSYKTIYVSGQTAPEEGNGEEAGEAEDTQSGVYAQIAELSGTGISFLFTNRYEPQKVNLNLTKVDRDGVAITDYQAQFMLYLEKGKENPVYEEPYMATDGEGKITFPDLKAGTYWLYELKAPSGYKLLAAPIEIQIAWGADGSPEVTIDGTKASESFNSEVVKNFEIKESAEDGKYTIHMDVVNKDFYKLPNSGGMGIYWYMIGGILLMMAAMLILYKNKRAGEVQGD